MDIKSSAENNRKVGEREVDQRYSDLHKQTFTDYENKFRQFYDSGNLEEATNILKKHPGMINSFSEEEAKRLLTYYFPLAKSRINKENELKEETKKVFKYIFKAHEEYSSDWNKRAKYNLCSLSKCVYGNARAMLERFGINIQEFPKSYEKFLETIK